MSPPPNSPPSLQQTHKEIDLSGRWHIHEDHLGRNPLDPLTVLKAERFEEGWLEQPVPGDVHQGLRAAGRIPDPLAGLNSYECEWIGRKAWWWRREFSVPADLSLAEYDAVELELDGLDSNAEIFLDGRHIGSHRNAFYPFLRDIKPFLEATRDSERTGPDGGAANHVLLIRLTSGLERVTEAEADSPDGIPAMTEANNGRPDRGDARRSHLRKPQFAFGWDWSPRLFPVAIGGRTRLHFLRKAVIRNVRIEPLEIPEEDGQPARLRAVVETDLLHYYRSVVGNLRIAVTDPSGAIQEFSRQVLLRSGLTYASIDLNIPGARLWWPRGQGEASLYTIDVSVDLPDDGARAVYQNLKYGIRRVELIDTDDFAVAVNGRRFFCLGANWIPPDALYAAASDEKYALLVGEAHAAGFNMLRVWGGGLYERDAFYDACDRLGILVWQDFMFACSTYPDHLDWFWREVETEAVYQTRRLCNRASLALWCGNNEIHGGFRDWWHEQTQSGARIYNYLLPRVVQANAPHVPYWNSSPYGGESPNGFELGDCHFWHETMMHPDMARRINPAAYDACGTRFLSEYGYIGAPAVETIRDFLGLPGDAPLPVDRTEAVFQHHTNVFEKNTVDAGIVAHYADVTTVDDKGARSVTALSPEDWVRYSGLVQGLMHGYIFDSMRAKPRCSGSLFWMFNDCWGEIGWTIVDYYLRRKPAFYYARRASAPLRLIIRPGAGGQLELHASNELPRGLCLAIECGYLDLATQSYDRHELRETIGAGARCRIATLPETSLQPERGIAYARVLAPEGIGADATAIYHRVRIRQLELPEPEFTINLDNPTRAGDHQLRISAKTYVHALEIQLPGGFRAEDNFFDLFPGETRLLATDMPCSQLLDTIKALTHAPGIIRQEISLL